MLLWLSGGWGNLSLGGVWQLIMVGMGELNLMPIFGDGVVFPFYCCWFRLIDSLFGECDAYAPGRRGGAVALVGKWVGGSDVGRGRKKYGNF